MMKYLPCILIPILWGLGFLSAHSQKNDYVWVFGDRNVLDFKTSPPTVDTLPMYNPNIEGNESAVSISNKSGDLVFYLDPSNKGSGHVQLPGHDTETGFMLPLSYLLNCRGEIIKGMDSVKVLASMRQTVAITVPEHENRYMLFTLWRFYGGEFVPQNLYYYELEVVEQPCEIRLIRHDSIVFNKLAQNLVANQHANGKDWWIIGSTMDADTFCTVLVTKDGVKSIQYQHFERDTIYKDDLVPELNVSNDGTLIVQSRTDGLCTACHNSFLTFNRGTGRFMEEYTYPFKGAGRVFSENDKFLYISKTARKDGILLLGLYQIELSNMDEVLISTSPDLGDRKLGPDGKLYFFSSHNKYVSIIHNPNEKGEKCNLELKAFELRNRLNYCLPNIPNFRMGALPPKYDFYDTIVCMGQKIYLGDSGSSDYHYGWEGMSDTTAYLRLRLRESSEFIRYTYCASSPCLFRVDTFAITIVPAPDFQTSRKNIMLYDCPEDSIYIDGSDPGFTYQWDDAPGFTEGNRWLYNREPKIYVRTRFRKGELLCPLSVDTFALQVQLRYDVYTTRHEHEICLGDTISIGINIPSKPNTFYQWYPKSGLSDSTGQIVEAFPGQTTDYVRHGYYSKDGCVYLYDTVTVRVVAKNQKPCLSGRPDGNIVPKLRIYPNPACNHFTIECSEGIKTVSMYDIMGKRVFFKESLLENVLKIDVNFFPHGIYLLQVETDGGSVTQKVVVE